MAKPKRKSYSNGGITLGERNGEATADFRDENNKRRRVRLGVPLVDLPAAKTALDRFAASRRAALDVQRQYTVGDLWSLWLAEREQDGFNNRIYNFNWVALKQMFENRAPLQLEAQDFRDYARSRFDDKIKPSTVHTELSRLSSCLKWAFETRKLPVRVKVWVPSPSKPRERVLSIQEAQRLVKGAEQGDPHIHLFVVLAFATGARHGAILDLTWDRIDFKNGVIQYDEDLPPDPMSKSYKKGRATVPMNNSVRLALEVAFRGRQTDHVIEHGGRRLRSIKDGFAAAVVRAGLGKYVPAPTEANADNMRVETDVTPHTIRHTVATWLDAVKVADGRRAQLLGHSDERTTRMHYTHASHELLQEAVDQLDVAFAPLPRIGLEEVPEAKNRRPKQRKLSQRDKRDTDQTPNENRLSS